jgi:hypothetical protein
LVHHHFITITIVTSTNNYNQYSCLQLSREGDSQPADVDENSQNILNLIKDTSNAAAG